MTPVQRAHHPELLEHLRTAIEGVDELPDGYAVRLPATAALTMLTAEFITLESLCCPFLGFALRLEAQAPLRLELTGPEGIKQFLQAEFGFG